MRTPLAHRQNCAIVHARRTGLKGNAVATHHPDGTLVRSPASDGQGAQFADPATTAVVVVDVQRLFTDLLGVAVEPPLPGVLAATTQLLDSARATGATVVLARTVIPPENHSQNTLMWPEAMRLNLMPGARGTDFDPAVTPCAGDVEIVKQRYSAFMGTPLHTTLRDRGIRTVMVLGLTTNVCVQSTARDAWQLDYDTITLSDCCSEVGSGSHEASLAWTARNFGRVCTSKEVLADWANR